MEVVTHSINVTFGWWLVLSAFATGALLGLGFHRKDFLGGYDSLRRRMARLGHIAQAALGMMNVLFGLAPWPADAGSGAVASAALMIGGVAMPTVCFLTAWKEPFRHLFFIPVAALATGVTLTALFGGVS